MSKPSNLSATRGNRAGIGFFRLLIKFSGVKCAFAFAYIVTFFYAVFDKKAFEAAKWYLALRFKNDAGKPFRLRCRFHKLIWELAKMMIVAAASAGNKKFSIVEKGCVPADDSKPRVIVFAHYGCWQAAMPMLGKPGRSACIMAAPDMNQAIDKFLALEQGAKNFRVISVTGFSGGLIEAAAALENGESVVIMGDRAVDGTPSVEVPFLGGKITLPLSPWMLGARCNCEVIPLFADYNEADRTVVLDYRAPLTLPDAGNRRVKNSDLIPAAEKYAAILAEKALCHPYRVFRFSNEAEREL